MQLDNTRTACHNVVLDSINILNRLAEQHGIPSIYDGNVVREQPYRREVADAVLGYVEKTIQERI